MKIKQDYDKFAENYDNSYSTDYHLIENEIIMNIIKPYSQDKNILTYDIGCGTGLLLDYIDINENNYLGIDPSKKMINVFSKKHPTKNTLITTLENSNFIPDNNTFLVSLFGSISYVDPEFFSNFIKKYQNNYYFFMFYTKGYVPHLYSDLQDIKQSSLEDFGISEKDTMIFNNYIIYTNLKGKK